MRLTSVDLKPIWDRAYAMHLGSAPYQVVMAAARLAGDRATHVLAEATVSDKGTSWRLMWLTEAVLGVIEAAVGVVNWSAHTDDKNVDPEVRATIRPLADCRRITYVQNRSHFDSFGPASEFRARTSVTLHFDDEQVDLQEGEWTHGDRDKFDEFQLGVLETWAKLRGQ